MDENLTLLEVIVNECTDCETFFKRYLEPDNPSS